MCKYLYDFKNARLTEKTPNSQIDQQQLVGSQGGLVSGLGPVIDWDSRDNVFYPSQGGWYRAWATLYREGLGSDFDFERYNLDLRHYIPLKPGHVLALQGVVAQTQGQVPFQTEYRFPIGGRFSGAAFAAVGDVVDQWCHLRVEDIKYGAGAGFRYQLDQKEKVNLRFDLGVSQWGVFPYINIMEAF
ncbi:hypothetical protein ACFL6U_25265 [Planctomycetota bacterium]